MARGGVRGSDFIFDFPCTPCFKGGHNVEGIDYCVDCSEYFCLACTKCHKNFGATSKHNVVNWALAPQAGGVAASTSPLPNETCREHQGDAISTYCADHDLVLCNTCVSANHRSCSGTSNILTVAKGSKQSKDVNKVKRDISESLKELNQTKISLQCSLQDADVEQKSQLQCVQDYADRLMNHGRELKETAVDDINTCHKTITDKIQSGIASLDDATTAMKDRLKNLDSFKINSDNQVFVDIKRGQQEVANAEYIKYILTPTITGKTMPEFVVSEDVDYFLDEVQGLSQYVGKKALKASLHGEYGVKMQREKHTCSITDICELSDGTILIVDCDNICIKKLNQSYNVTDCLNMASHPGRVCQTGRNEVAVTTCYDRKVQFVDVRKKLKLSRSFNLEKPGRGICYSKDELFIACKELPKNEQFDQEEPGFVGVYSMSGSLLRKLQFDHWGQRIFYWPRQITASENGDKFYIADWESGLIVIDRQGRVLSVLSDGLQEAYDVCAVSEGSLIVSGYGSNNVLQIDAEGQMVAELLGDTDGIKKPLSVLFISSTSSLVISEALSDKIKVFKLK